MSSRDKEMEERLSAAGVSLLQIPLLHDELLALLDQTEELLQKVEQSPSRSMQTALSPLMKALVVEELLKHSDVDVKAGIACCISEITRITAPDAPYDDDIMKDVFQLIVSTFENLSDMSSRSYDKRTTILETVAKVRSCVIMLDLECDKMIIEMFRHFLKAIRVNHPEVVFGSMEAIMTLVLEESEDICPELLMPILDALKINNEDVMPIARKLAESVIQSSADRVRPYLTQTVKQLGADLDDFGKVVASVCRRNTDIVSISRDQSVAMDGREETNLQKIDSNLIGSKSGVSNGIIEAVSGEIMTDAKPRKADSNNQVDATSEFKADSDDCSAQNQVKSEANTGNSEAQVACDHEIVGKDVPLSPTKAKPVESTKSLDKVKDTISQLSPSQAPENEVANVVSPAQSGSLAGEGVSKKYSSAEEENLDGEETLSVDTPSKKACEGESVPKSMLAQKGKKRSGETTVKDQASTGEGESKNDEGSASVLGGAVSEKTSEGESISKSKKVLQKGKRRADETIDKDQALTEEGASRKDEGNTNDSKAKSLNRAKDVGDVVSKNAFERETISKSKKLPQKGKKRSDKTTDKDQASTEEGASDSEARTLNQTEKPDAPKKASQGESRTKAKKQWRKGTKPSDETTDEDQTLTEEGGSKNDEGSTGDSEARTLNQTKQLRGVASKKASKEESISKAKRQRRKGKMQSDEITDKDKVFIDEGASKNDEGGMSDSEERSRDKMEKLEDVTSKKGSEKESISVVKKPQRRGRKRSVRTTDEDRELTEEDASKNDKINKSDSKNVSSMTKGDAKIGGRPKSTSGKDALKSSSTEVHVKDQVTSPRTPLKSLKDEDTQEETPRMSSKRKRTPGTTKESSPLKYGKNLVGSKVKVWWPEDKEFYEGVIESFDYVKKKHRVHYDDGEVEVLNLRKEQWEIIGDDPVSDGDAEVEHSGHDTSDVQRKRKKRNTNSESSKSSKRQKTMYGSSRSGKSRDDGKQDSETKVDNSKPGKTSGGNKFKDDSAKTPSQPIKQGNQKSSAKFKGKTSTKTSSSQKVKKSGKALQKTTPSKVKENDMKEKLLDLAESSTPDSANSGESEGRIGKKRRN